MVRLYASLAPFLEKCLKSFVAKRLNHVLNCKPLINTCQFMRHCLALLHRNARHRKQPVGHACQRGHPPWQISLVIGGGFRIVMSCGMHRNTQSIKADGISCTHSPHFCGAFYPDALRYNGSLQARRHLVCLCHNRRKLRSHKIRDTLP